MAESSVPTGDGPLPDVLTRRALTRQHAQAWERGDGRVSTRCLHEPPDDTGAKDVQQAAPWDRYRELARALGQNPDGPADHGPGLARGRDRPGPTPFDPRTGQCELRYMVADNDQTGKLAVASVVARWWAIADDQIAEHYTIESFDTGRTTLHASSSSWARQLRLLQPTIEVRIVETLYSGPDGCQTGGIGTDDAMELRILGPTGSTRKRHEVGLRGTRGPRGTYGQQGAGATVNAPAAAIVIGKTRFGRQELASTPIHVGQR